jgi:SAM-dependent methyltransferase
VKKILDMNKKAWDNLAESYDERSISPISDVFNAFTELIPENGKILDLGCGTGVPYAKFLVGKDFDVLGVDLSPEMVKVASSNVSGARFEQMSMTDILYVSEFDGVLSNFSMLLLIPDMFKEAAKRIYTALKDGGYFYLALNEPAEESSDPESDVIVNIMGQEMYSRAYTVKEIEETFIPLGFTRVIFHREIQVSEEFGEEHVIEFIYQKMR